MGLKQDIVIKNEFTINRSGVATKGATPGFYVVNYMARNDATETLSPVQFSNIDDFQLRYMSRKSAADEAISRDGFKDKIKRTEGKSGVSFSEDNISLSHKQLMEKAKRIQKAFDEGHTVQKIVLSFTEEYLKNMGVVDSNFKMSGPGSYRGNIDQLKLRRAISDGLLAMAREAGFEKPTFTAVIQVDTKHVHCHIALCDLEFSEDRLNSDFEERGKLSKKSKKILRRTLNNSLEEMIPQQSFNHQVDLERRNVLSYIKNLSSRHINNGSKLQLILSALPPDKDLWSFENGSKVMRRPNELAESFLKEMFEAYPVETGYESYRISLDEFVENYSNSHKLTNLEIIAFMERMDNIFIKSCVNNLYDVLKTYEKPQDIMTGMIDLSIRDVDEILPEAKENDDSASFELRLRGYRDRLKYHRENADMFHQYLQNFLNSPRLEEAFPIKDFYETELRYHRDLVKKYNFLLIYRDTSSDAAFQEASRLYEEFMEQQEVIDSYNILFNDPPEVLRDMSPGEQDEFVLNNFGIEKGSWFMSPALAPLVREDFSVEETKRNVLREKYEAFLDEHDMFTSYAENDFDENLPGEPQISVSEAEFNEVKAEDIHDLVLDFVNGSPVSQGNITKFHETMLARKDAYEKAMDYFESTSQPTYPFDEAGRDIAEMETFYENHLRPYHQISPFEFKEEAKLERSLAPHPEDIENQEEIVKKVIEQINIANLEREASATPQQGQTPDSGGSEIG